MKAPVIISNIQKIEVGMGAAEAHEFFSGVAKQLLELAGKPGTEYANVKIHIRTCSPPDEKVNGYIEVLLNHGRGSIEKQLASLSF